MCLTYESILAENLWPNLIKLPGYFVFTLKLLLIFFQTDIPQNRASMNIFKIDTFAQASEYASA